MYVVRKLLQYVHGFEVGLGSDCRAVAEKVRWTNLQRLAFRFADRNAAASTAMDLDAYVVRLRPKCVSEPLRAREPNLVVRPSK